MDVITLKAEQTALSQTDLSASPPSYFCHPQINQTGNGTYEAMKREQRAT